MVIAATARARASRPTKVIGGSSETYLDESYEGSIEPPRPRISRIFFRTSQSFDPNTREAHTHEARRCSPPTLDS
jgi:hypothetical protein